ncbi:MAG: enoyl-CoA hydratase-related protein [Thermaerobacter sp.]|nr:enoyl-CoA hydratase-related protein [Thermaerobacter sp.]
MNLTELEIFPDDRIARITLNNPAKRNALSYDLLGSLEERLTAMASARTVNVIIIRAEGPVFSAGHDLREILGHPTPAVRDLFLRCGDTMRAIRRAPQVVIAEVDGIATAAGCQLVAAADLAVASTTSRFATPGVKIGYFCGTPAVHVSRNLPLKKAAEMLFTGEFMTAEEALQHGLVNRLAPPGETAGAVWTLAQSAARFSLAVLESGKQLLYRQQEMPEEGALTYATEFMALQSATPDAHEGITAFFAKRDPAWSDRTPFPGHSVKLHRAE